MNRKTKVILGSVGAVAAAAVLMGGGDPATPADPAAAEPTASAAAAEQPAGEQTSAPVEEQERPQTLSQAFCSDLEQYTPMQIWGGVKDQYTPKAFADYAYGAAAISCPEQLRDNEALRAFLEAWNIDPDA
jgi:hypothetical protein